MVLLWLPRSHLSFWLRWEMVGNFTHTRFFLLEDVSSSKLKFFTKTYVLVLTGKHPSVSGMGCRAKLETASAALPGCGRPQSCPCSSCTQLFLQTGPTPTGEAGRASHSVASAVQPSPPRYGSSWPPGQAPYVLEGLKVWSPTQEENLLKYHNETGHEFPASPASGLVANLKQPRGARSSRWWQRCWWLVEICMGTVLPGF